MKSKKLNNFLDQTCRICLLHEPSVLIIPCGCCLLRPSGAHVECFKYWTKHLKKFHGERVRIHKRFDEIDCEGCEETMIFPKKRVLECRNLEEIKSEFDLDLMDIMGDISLLVILMIGLSLLAYFTVLSFTDECKDGCVAAKIMLTFFASILLVFMFWPVRKLMSLFMREEYGREAFKKNIGQYQCD